MSKAFLITGFNNWGKTTIINKLFDKPQKKAQFTYGLPYTSSKFKPRKFIVGPKSNDDIVEKVGIISYINEIWKRYGKHKINDYDLIAAFCPTKEENNNSFEILNNELFKSFDKIYILLIVNKWDEFATFTDQNIENIRNHYLGLNNIEIVEIPATNQILEFINQN